jgi:hypothetical protein
LGAIIFIWHAEWVETRHLTFRNFDSHLRIKVMGLPICLYRKPFSCNVKKKYGCAAYLDDPLPNIVYIAIWMPACIVWFYYASSWWFPDHFFYLVCGPLEKGKKKYYSMILVPRPLPFPQRWVRD